MNRNNLVFLLVLSGALLAPETGFCTVEGTLGAIQSKLINQILPLAGTLGICWSAFSFFTGNPGARTHLFLACIGALIGFGAPQLIMFIQSLIR